MDVITRQQTPGKSLPAELVVGGGNGLLRLMQNGDMMQHRGWRGVRGVGDDPTSAQEAAQILQATEAATLPLVVANTPGVYYTQNPATGQITVSSQPVYGGVLPGGVLPGGATVTAGGGQVTAGISSGTLMMIGLVGLLGFMMMQRR